MNYHKLGFAVSFTIHLIFVALAFYIMKPATQENMEVVMEFNVTNIIKTGESETDTNTMKTTGVTENEVSIPAMVKQETRNTVEEEILEKPDEATKRVKQTITDTKRESKSIVNSDKWWQSGGIPKSDRDKKRKHVCQRAMAKN